MSGALVELVSVGAQDVYLTGKPEVSFFRQMYKRYTNFAMKPVKLLPQGVLAQGSTVSLKLLPKGDLLSYVWIDMGVSAATIGASGIGGSSAAPAVFELYIGGQLIDRQDAVFAAYLWHKFLADNSAKPFSIVSNSTSDNIPKTNLFNGQFLPLQFFFCNSSYLPLLALQYHEVEIKVTFSSASAPPADISFYANYVMLDTDERKSFTDKPLELLVEQVQKLPFNYTGAAAIPTGGTISAPTAPTNLIFDLNLLNHPVKCLMWTDVTSDHLVSNNIQLYLNGSEVFESRMSDRYFASVQGYYHSEFASELLKGTGGGASGFSAKMYSFALKVNRHQPTGTCNFSRLDNAKLDMTVYNLQNTSAFNLYAVNYNVLRIQNGLGGLAFSN